MVFTLDKLQFNPTGRDSYWISDCGDYKIHKKVRNTQETTITNYYPITMSEVDPLDTLPPFGFLNFEDAVEECEQHQHRKHTAILKEI